MVAWRSPYVKRQLQAVFNPPAWHQPSLRSAVQGSRDSEMWDHHARCTASSARPRYRPASSSTRLGAAESAPAS